MKQNDEIENLFESAFDDFSVVPPEQIKVVIDEKINFKKRSSNRWGLRLLSLLFVSIVGVFVFYYSSHSNESTTKTLSTTSGNISTNEKSAIYSDSSKSNQTNSKYNDDSINQPQKKSNTDTKSTTIIFEEKNILSKTINSISNNTSNNTSNKQQKSIVNTANTSQIKAKQKAKNNSFNNTAQNVNSNINSNQTNLTSPLNQSTSLVTYDNNLIDSDNKNLSTSKDTNESVSINDSNTNTLINESNTLTSINKVSNDNTSLASQSTKLSENKIDTLNSNLVINTNKVNPVDSLSDVKMDETKASWFLSARFGYSLISNKIKNEEYVLTEKNAFFIHTEVSYLLKNNMNLSTGIQYNLSRINLAYNTSKVDSLFIGTDTVVIVDSLNAQNDTIHVSIYDYFNTNTTHNQTYNQTMISIPLYFGFNFKINEKWFIDVNGGVIFSYQQAKRVSSDPQIPDPTIRYFGMKFCFRPQLRYHFSDKMGVSLSTNIGYDIAPTLNWNNTTRTRIFSEFGIGFHYSF